MKHMIKLLSLALCAAFLLSTAALAAEKPEAADDETAPLPQVLAPVGVWGTVTKQENGSLLLKSGDPDAANQEIVIHLTEKTWYVDGVTGLPLEADKIKDGDTLYIWVGPAMTMSLPPQTTAVVVVGNVPAGGKAPQYAEITAPAIFPAPGGTERRLPIAGGDLTVLEAAEVTPFRTKNIVTLDDLVPGAQLLAWSGEDGKINRVLLLPYAYEGYLTGEEDGAIRFGGEKLSAKSRTLTTEDGKQVYLPLRAVAEAAGYTVGWVSGKGAVVSQEDTELFSVQTGSDTAKTPDGEHGLLGGCVIDQGVTYLPAGDFAQLLNVYFYN